MAWAIRLDERQIVIDDLPISDVDRIAQRHGVTWYELTTSRPANHPAAFYDLIRFVAERLDVPPPDHDGSVRSMKSLLELIVRVDDDLPDGWEDGRPLEDGPTTD